MSLDQLVAQTFGPSPRRISPEKAAEYVTATGDDPERWAGVAPPSFVGLLLFVAASEFLRFPGVAAHTRVFLHTHQDLHWHEPLTLGRRVEVVGVVDRVRQRGPVSIVTFSTRVLGEDGVPLAGATSRFLMGAEPAGPPAEEWPEPPAGDHGPSRIPARIPLPARGARLPELAKSASRTDLVRYAGASGDFNPIHFDHAAAVGAGLPGVVVHGLLMAAWVSQLASACSDRNDPLAELSLRFRAPLRPGAAAAVAGEVEAIEADAAILQVAVRSGEELLVTGRATVRTG
jgi:acyl dehydratase